GPRPGPGPGQRHCGRVLGTALGLAPAPEHEPAQCEAEPERAEGEAADRDRLAPRREPLPAPECLALLRRQRFAATLLTNGAAGSQTEIEVVEDLGGLFGHWNQSIACLGRAYTRSPPVRPALRRRSRRGDRARRAGPDRAIRARARDRERRPQPSWSRGPARERVAVPPLARPTRARDPREPRHPVYVPRPLYPRLSGVRAPVGDDRADVHLAGAACGRAQLRATVATPVGRAADEQARGGRGTPAAGAAVGVPDRGAPPPPDRRAVALAEKAGRAPKPRPRHAGRRGGRPEPSRPHSPRRRQRPPRGRA